MQNKKGTKIFFFFWQVEDLTVVERILALEDKSKPKRGRPFQSRPSDLPGDKNLLCLLQEQCFKPQRPPPHCWGSHWIKNRYIYKKKFS